MSTQRTRAVAWSVWGVSIAAVATGIGLSLVPPAEFRSQEADPYAFSTLVVVFATAGAVIVSRANSNRVGWIYLASGLLGGLFMSLASVSNTAKLMGWDSWALLGALASTTYFPWIFSMVVFPVMLFPDGRLPSRRWRIVAWAAFLLIGSWVGSAIAGPAYEPNVAGLTIVDDGRVEISEANLTLWAADERTESDVEPQVPVLESSEFSGTPGGDVFFRSDTGDRFVTESGDGVLESDGTVLNPLHVEQLEGFFAVVQGPLGLLLLVIAMGGTVGAVVVRLKRSQGVERLQMKWLAFSASLAGTGLLLTYVVGTFYEGWLIEVFTIVGLVGALLIPITTAMAIVRYRLYDIDRLISRTVVYGLLVALLAGVYAGAVFLFSQLLPDDNSITVAISTLAVAALFNPFRRRIQQVIDRRLHRAHYDAQEVVDHFSGRLSHGIDTASIEEELLEVLDATVAPQTAGLWIRKPD